MAIENVEVLSLVTHEDSRGWVMEILRREHVPSPVFGQIYITTAHPGISKGNHHHSRKTEWFCVLMGTAKLVLEDIHSHERREIMMGPGEQLTVKIPPGVAHGILNVGRDTLYLLAYVDEPYEPEDPDTFPYEIDYGKTA